MGAPELVPFETEAHARAFIAEHGGTIMRLEDIPSEAVLGGVDRPANTRSAEDQS
jgi:copper chaperone NosL